MKWSSILALVALVVFVSACEKHPASELPHQEPGHHDVKAGEHHDTPKAGEHGDAPKASGGHAEAPKAAEGAHGEVKPGEAPKFFPPESK